MYKSRKNQQEWKGKLMGRLLLFAFLLMLIYFTIKSFFATPKKPAPNLKDEKDFHSEPAEETVQDPECGIYLSPKEAISYQRGKEILYFCSEKCKENYLKKIKA